MLEQFKVHDWNAEQEDNNVVVSFKIQGINKPAVFCQVFEAGKGVIESGGDFADYVSLLMNLVLLVRKGLKKSL